MTDDLTTAITPMLDQWRKDIDDFMGMHKFHFDHHLRAYYFRLDEAEKALRAVVEVHERVTEDLPTFSGMKTYTYCRHCHRSTGDMRDNPWPCPTIRAVTKAFDMDDFEDFERRADR